MLYNIFHTLMYSLSSFFLKHCLSSKFLILKTYGLSIRFPVATRNRYGCNKGHLNEVLDLPRALLTAGAEKPWPIRAACWNISDYIKLSQAKGYMFACAHSP